jgi:hypothetical protein
MLINLRWRPLALHLLVTRVFYSPPPHCFLNCVITRQRFSFQQEYYYIQSGPLHPSSALFQ